MKILRIIKYISLALIGLALLTPYLIKEAIRHSKK